MSDVAVITLTNGTRCTLDAADADLVRNFIWRAQGSRPENVYATASIVSAKGVRTTVRMHRLILGASKGQIVDHVNGDRMDNRRSNLRITDAAGNAQNASKRRGQSGGKSAFKGLTYNPSAPNKPWRVFVYHAKRRTFVGSFASELEAAAAYDKAAKLLHGEFARTNQDLGLLAA